MHQSQILFVVGLFFEDFPSPQINAPQINLHSCGRLVRLAGGFAMDLILIVLQIRLTKQ